MSALFSAAGPSTQLPQPGLSAAALAPGAKLAIFLVNDEAMTNYLNEQFLRRLLLTDCILNDPK